MIFNGRFVVSSGRPTLAVAAWRDTTTVASGVDKVWDMRLGLCMRTGWF